MKIYKKWGHDSVGRIRENPYRLCREFAGIGFKKADEIALTIGFPADGAARLDSGVTYVLNAIIQRTGNTLVEESVSRFGNRVASRSSD